MVGLALLHYLPNYICAIVVLIWEGTVHNARTNLVLRSFFAVVGLFIDSCVFLSFSVKTNKHT